MAAQKFRFAWGEHITVVGCPGSGKTQWVYNILKSIPRMGQTRAIVVNTMALKGFHSVSDVVVEDSGDIEFFSDNDKEREFSVELPELEKYLWSEDEVDPINGQISQRAPRVIELNLEATVVLDKLDRDYRLRNRISDYYKEIMETICRMALKRRNVLIVADEMPNFLPLNNIGNASAFVIRQGRNYGITIVGACQRTQDLAAEFRDNCAHWILFYVNLRNRMTQRDKVPHIEATEKLEPFHWIWVYNKSEDQATFMRPVPLIYDDSKDTE